MPSNSGKKLPAHTSADLKPLFEPVVHDGSLRYRLPNAHTTHSHTHTEAQPAIVIGLASKMNSLFRFEILFSKAAQKSFHSKIKNDEKNTERKKERQK